MSADGFWLTVCGWDETGPRTRARARPLARVGEGCRARISGLSAGVATWVWVWGRGVVVGGGGVAVTVRLDERTLRALMERAALEGIGSRSDAIRAAVREWTHVA